MTPPNEKPVGNNDQKPFNKNGVIFTGNQINLIRNIQKIHDSCGKKNNFEETYKEVILLIKNKSTPLWYEGVANQLVDILEYCTEDFFNSFTKPDESNEAEFLQFENHKKRIVDSHEIIQSIKHKRRENLSKIFRGEYHEKVAIDLILTNENYDQIFGNHELLLIGFFEKYNLNI